MVRKDAECQAHITISQIKVVSHLKPMAIVNAPITGFLLVLAHKPTMEMRGRIY